MPRIYALIITLLLVNIALAQKDTTQFREPVLMLKFSPISMVDLTPALQFALEHRIYKQFYAQYEAGYINDYGLSLSQSNYYGFRVRPEIRYYALDMQQVFQKDQGHFYVSLDFLYKRTWEERVDDFSRFGGAYFQRLTYKMQKTIFASHIKMGASYFNPTDSWFAEMGMGMGIRFLNKENINIPDDAVDSVRRGIFERSAGKYTLPSAVLTLKVGYILK